MDAECSDASDAADDRQGALAVLEEARARQCRTIAFGRGSHFWKRELEGGRLLEHLVRNAGEIAIWVAG
jgi:hypothetical protein